MQSVPPPLWIAACAHQLQRRWRTVHPAELEDVARSLWDDQRLRDMSPDEAARAWLAPIDRTPE
jgi:hypothetical protein